jgi:DNA invertase Pin-like site-specific DNA recombinase
VFPQDDNIHHETERAKLIFLSLPITLAQFAPLAMKDRACQFVAVLAPIQLCERPSPFSLVIDVREAMNGFVDAPDFGNCLSQLRRAFINPKRSHYRCCLDYAKLQGTGKAKYVIPVVLDQICINTMARNTIEATVVRCRIDAPIPGATRQRPEFQRMLNQTMAADTTIVWKLDRLARSTRDLLNTMETLGEAGAKFQSISEPWASTTTHAGKMIMTVFAGIAEFERDLIRERTGAGREAAKKRGVQLGRPRKLNPDQVRLASELLDQGKAVREIARTFNVHEATIYRLAAAE